PVTIHVVDLCLLDEQKLAESWPAAFDRGMPLNLIVAASLLEKLGRDQPGRLAALRERVQNDQVEICGGPFQEREDALLPVETQLWNLLKGLTTYEELLGKEIRIFSRKRFAASPQLPLFLHSVGLHRAVALAFDTATLPSYRSTVTSWPSPDGKQIEAFT